MLEQWKGEGSLAQVESLCGAFSAARQEEVSESGRGHWNPEIGRAKCSDLQGWAGGLTHVLAAKPANLCSIPGIGRRTELILELSSDYHTCTVVFVNIYIQYIKISAKSLKSPVIISMGLIGWNFRIDMCGPEASLAYTEKPCFKKLKTNKQIKNTPPPPNTQCRTV